MSMLARMRIVTVCFTAVLLISAACVSGGATPRAAERAVDAAEDNVATIAPSPTIPPTPVPTPAPAPWGAPPLMSGDGAPPVSAAAAAVLDEASGALLYAKDADLPLGPASLTKIATAVVALERGDLDAEVTVDVDSRVMFGSTVMGLLPGDRFTLRDLLYGMMLPSGNDAALAIGRFVAGSDAAFVSEMNALGARLGLAHTHFANPHGLSARDHLTTARDLAVLARYAMSVPGFPELVSAARWTATGSRTIELSNINGFLFTYPGADGLKTGFTRRAGPTIVASAMHDGHRVYVVLLNDGTRDDDARMLMDWAFSAFQWPGATGSLR